VARRLYSRRFRRPQQELVKNVPIAPPTDGFDTPDDDVGGGATSVKFDAATQSLWFDRNGGPIPRKPWIAVRCHKEAVWWAGKKIVDRIDESQAPDIDALNKAIPQSEWEEGFDGEPKPPWSMQYSVFLVNPENGSKIISSNSTFGQRAAYSDLKGRVQFMRNFRSQSVVPIVELSSVMMKTRFGTKARPHFEILDWRTFGPTSAAPAIAGPVTKPSSAEITGDAIPDHPASVGVLPWDDEIGDLIP
jgi:hypothetical protein